MKKIEILFCTTKKPIILDDVKEVVSLDNGILTVWRTINGYDELCLYDHVSMYNEEV